MRRGRRRSTEPAPGPDDADDVDAEPGPGRPPRPTCPTIDAADLELALRYLPDYRVIVVAEPLAPDVLRRRGGAVGWSGALARRRRRDGATRPACPRT